MRLERRLVLTAVILGTLLPGTASSQQSVRTKLIELVKSHEKIEQLLERAEALVKERKLVEARAALQAAVRVLDTANGALRDLERALAARHQKPLPPRIKKYIDQNRNDIIRKGLSIIEVRIMRGHISPDDLPEPGDEIPGWFRSLERFLPRVEVVEAKVLRVHTVGMRRGGLLLAPQRRRDLVPGRTVKLTRRAPVLAARLKKGREYWVVIWPAFSHYIPNMLFGGGSGSAIVLTEPSGPPRRRRL